MRLRSSGRNYRWFVLVACFLMVFVGLGFCSSNKGLYLAAITEALDLPRSLFAVNDTFRHVSTAVTNLFFGALVARFGTRRMVAFGFLSLIASCLLYARAEHICVFYLGGLLLGMGLTFTTTSLASVVIRRWFKTNVGTYTGIVLAANGLGGAAAAQIVSPIIYREGDPFGYRDSYLLVALILLITGAIVVALLREGPSGDTGEQPITSKKARGASWAGVPYEVVKTRPYFYLAAAGVLLTGFILQGITGAYVAHLKDVGMDASYVATVVSAGALALTAAKMAVGALYDRFGLRPVMILCEAATAAAFLLLAFLDASGAGRVKAMIFVALYSLALPLETLVVPLIANDLFGNASYDHILGVLISMNYAGFALSAPVVNLCYDLFGSYRPILLVFSGLMAAVGILFHFVINESSKEKRAILATPE